MLVAVVVGAILICWHGRASVTQPVCQCLRCLDDSACLSLCVFFSLLEVPSAALHRLKRIFQ